MIHQRIDDCADTESCKTSNLDSQQLSPQNGGPLAPKRGTVPPGRKKTVNGVFQENYPVEFLAAAQSMREEILKRFPEGGAAALKLRDLCERYGVSLSRGARLLGIGQSTLDRRVHLYEDFAEIYPALKEVMPKITEPHLRELSRIADRHAALVCLVGAVDQSGEKLPVRVLRKYISDRSCEEGFELRTRRVRRRSPARITKMVTQARDAAIRWNPDHPAIADLDAALTALAT